MFIDTQSETVSGNFSGHGVFCFNETVFNGRVKENLSTQVLSKTKKGSRLFTKPVDKVVENTVKSLHSCGTDEYCIFFRQIHFNDE